MKRQMGRSVRSTTDYRHDDDGVGGELDNGYNIDRRALSGDPLSYYGKLTVFARPSIPEYGGFVMVILVEPVRQLAGDVDSTCSQVVKFIVQYTQALVLLIFIPTRVSTHDTSTYVRG